MSRLFTLFEILSHNLAFVCAPTHPQSTTGHTPHFFAYICASIAPLGQYDALRGYCLRQYTALYRPHRASAIRALCYGYFAALNTPMPCAIAHAGNTRICARLSPRWGNTTLCAAIVCDNTPRSMLRLFRCAQYAVPAPLCAQSIVRAQSIALRALFTVPPPPHSPPLMAHAPKTNPHPRHFLKIVEKKRLTYFFFFLP